MASILNSPLTFLGRLIILITMVIYVRAGRDIWKKYRQLRDFSGNCPHELDTIVMVQSPFGNIKTTEVSVTSEKAARVTANWGPVGSSSVVRREPQIIMATGPKPPSTAYSVTISTNRRQSHSDSSQTPTAGKPEELAVVAIDGAGADNNVAPGQSRNTSNPLRRKVNYEASRATWSYTKCAVLFFTAMLVTWIPSSANRVYSVLNPGEVSMVLEYLSSFVLPLQGFWNGIIYAVISWEACKMLFEDKLSRSQRPSFHEVVFGAERKPGSKDRNSRTSTTGLVKHRDPESESVAELAKPRPISQERESSNASKEEV